MSFTRRSFLGTGALAGISLFDPDIVLGADKTLTIALPNNPTTLDPMQISNHDSMAVSNLVFENLLEVDLEVRKHANYWRKGVPAWDRMVAKIVTEDAARVAYLMTNQAQIISAPPPREFERLKTAPGIMTGNKVAVGGMWFMQTNTKRAPFDDVNFRKAVSCAIDRKKIAK